MPTLGEACQLLRISRRTLDKWIARINKDEPDRPIEIERHKDDLRFHMISTEDIQRIRTRRAQMPGMAVYSGYGFTPHYPPSSPPARLDMPANTGDGQANKRRAPFPRPILAGDSFRTHAEGYRFLALHGVNERTPKTWAGKDTVERSPRAFLLWALSIKQPGNHRQPWELHRCEDPACVCQELLPDAE